MIPSIFKLRNISEYFIVLCSNIFYRKQIFINLGCLDSYMGLLNILFGSREAVAEEIREDDEAIIKHWKNYLNTVSKRKDIIEKLTVENAFQGNLSEFKKLLELELIDISDEEKEESELIDDLEVIEHSKKIKRVQKLEQCLDYAETKYEYVYGLLGQLHSILTFQMRILNDLADGSRETERIERLLNHLKSQFELERETLSKIEQIESFHGLFLALIKGEHTIKTMDEKEQILLKKIQNGVSEIFSNEITEGITYTWATAVFNAVQDIVMDHETLIAKGYDPHSDIDFEFVNGPDFASLVKECIPKLNGHNVSEQMIDVFVHLFREWYNHERD